MTAALPRYARLHVLTLSTFAVAQPLFDLIGRNPQFLVAHGLEARGVIALVLSLSLGAGLVLVGSLEVLRLAGTPARVIGQHVMIGVLAGLVVASPVRAFTPAAALALSIAGAVAGAALYTRQGFRTFLTVLAPSVILFPVIFLVTTPVSRLLRPVQTGVVGLPIERQPPIVFVTFDELSAFDILDDRGEIDAAHFPSFAAIAHTSTWFPNALTAFPYTERAIPAMLTGVAADGGDGRLPILADYPQNLFTWLAGSYALHVSEPVTSLCPERTCLSDVDSNRPATADLVADVVTLYLHLVTPRAIADRRLPSLANTWQRFRTGGAVAAAPPRPRNFDVGAEFVRAAQPGRGTLFRRFVAGVTRRSQPTLHFIHVLLPHDPYVATPQGRRYAPGGLTEGMGADGVWTKEQPIVDTGRARHIAQARLSDKLLGELFQKLRDERLFDEALVIVTSDHGEAFQPGQSHRGMTESNAAEIQVVPMFVKLPHQHSAAVNERPVSSLDIVPTIAEVLHCAVPWPLDGHPMLAAEYPAKTHLILKNAGVGPLPVFDVRAKARERLFGGPALTRTSPAPELVGTAVPETVATEGDDGIRVFSEDFARLESVNFTAGATVPALISGEIQSDRPLTDRLTLAIAVNGTIGAVTRTARWNASSHYFTVLLPEELLHAGKNALAVYRVTGPAGARQLVLLSNDFAGLQIPTIISDRVTGAIDQLIDEPENIRLLGWAADRSSADPVRSIVAFSGGRAIAVASPKGERPDVSAALQLHSGQKTSFSLAIPRHAVSGPIRVVAISRTREIGDLQSSAEIARRLAGAK